MGDSRAAPGFGEGGAEGDAATSGVVESRPQRSGVREFGSESPTRVAKRPVLDDDATRVVRGDAILNVARAAAAAAHNAPTAPPPEEDPWLRAWRDDPLLGAVMRERQRGEGKPRVVTARMTSPSEAPAARLVPSELAPRLSANEAVTARHAPVPPNTPPLDASEHIVPSPTTSGKLRTLSEPFMFPPEPDQRAMPHALAVPAAPASSPPATIAPRSSWPPALGTYSSSRPASSRPASSSSRSGSASARPSSAPPGSAPPGSAPPASAPRATAKFASSRSPAIRRISERPSVRPASARLASSASVSPASSPPMAAAAPASVPPRRGASEPPPIERQSVPRVLKSPQEVSKLPIDHREGFLLAHVDGMQTVEEILDVCPMPSLTALQLIERLRNLGVIAFD